jgi:hypothetical protein
MTASITERIRDHVLRHGPVTAEQVAQAIPELAECGGEQRALLLLRLDPQVEPTGTNLWAARGTYLIEERKVHRVAEEYFYSLARPGAPLSSAVAAIAEGSKVESPKVEEILRNRYVIVGTNVFNKLRHYGGR